MECIHVFNVSADNIEYSKWVNALTVSTQDDNSLKGSGLDVFVFCFSVNAIIVYCLPKTFAF